MNDMAVEDCSACSLCVHFSSSEGRLGKKWRGGEAGFWQFITDGKNWGQIHVKWVYLSV